MQEYLPLISVIVPVYQVEDYLSQCIDSILNQTYTNLEIILVDDGSKDNSGNICDEYARKDKRIRVIHKQNGGAPSARNAGLAVILGKYVGFVDPDDWLEPGMYETLYNAIECGNDIAVCSYYYDDIGREYVVGGKESFTVNSYQALEMLISDEITNHTWNKLYARELFEDLSFPNIKSFDDVAIMYLLFDKANMICVVNNPLYHYRFRKTGLMGTKRISDMLDYCELRIERYKYCKVKYPDMCCKHIRGIADATVRMAAANIMCHHEERQNNRHRRHIIRSYYDENKQYGYMLSGMEKIIFYLSTREKYFLDILAVGLEVIRRKISKCHN